VHKDKALAFFYSAATSAAFITLTQLMTRTDIKNDNFLFIAMCCLAASIPMLTISALVYVLEVKTSPTWHRIINAMGAYIGAGLFACALFSILWSFGKMPACLFMVSYLLAAYVFKFHFSRSR